MTSALPRIKEPPNGKTGDSAEDRPHSSLDLSAVHQPLSATIYERYLTERSHLSDKLKSLHVALEDTNAQLHSAYSKSESLRDLIKAYKQELETSAEIISEEKANAEFLEARFLEELKGDKEISARRVQQKIEAERQLQDARREMQHVEQENRELERLLEVANVEVERLGEGTRSAQREADNRQAHYRHQMDHLLNESDRLDHHIQLSNQQLQPLKATHDELESRLDKLLREEQLLQGQLDKKIEILAQSDREVRPKEQTDSAENTVSDSIPRGIIGVVFCNVEHESQLWEAIPETMLLSLDTYTKLCRDGLKMYNGYEVKSEGDFFMASFRNGLDALKWAMSMQSSLMVVNWPDRLLSTEWCAKVSVNGRPVFRGLRVRMGINEGAAQTKINPVTGRADYFGPEINKAARIGSLASGGQVLVSETVLQRFHEDRDLQANCATVPLGKHGLRGFKGSETIHQILPKTLAERSFSPLQHTPPLGAKQQQPEPTSPESKQQPPQAPQPQPPPPKPTIVEESSPRTASATLSKPSTPSHPDRPATAAAAAAERDRETLQVKKSDSDKFETSSSNSMYGSARLIASLKSSASKAKKAATTVTKTPKTNKKNKSSAGLKADAKAKADATARVAHQINRDKREQEQLIERRRKLNFEAADITLKMYAARDSADSLVKKNAELLARAKNLKEQLGWEVQAKNELHTKVFVWMREEAEREAAIERTFQNLQTLISRQSVLEESIVVLMKERDSLKKRLEDVQRNSAAWAMLQNMRELDEQLSHEVEVLALHKEVRENYLARLEALIASMDFLHPTRKPLPAPGETPRIVNGVFTRSNSLAKIDAAKGTPEAEKSDAVKAAEMMQSIANMQLQLYGAKMEKALYGEIGKWLALQLEGLDNGGGAMSTRDHPWAAAEEQHSDDEPKLVLEDLLLGDEDEEGHEQADPITLYAPDDSHKTSDIIARMSSIQTQVEKEQEQVNKMESEFAELKASLELQVTINAEQFSALEEQLQHCMAAQAFLRQLLMAEYAESSAEVLKRAPIDTTGINGETRAIAELQAKISEQLAAAKPDGQQTLQVELLGKILRGETVHVHELEQAGLSTEPPISKSRPASRPGTAPHSAPGSPLMSLGVGGVGVGPSDSVPSTARSTGSTHSADARSPRGGALAANSGQLNGLYAGGVGQGGAASGPPTIQTPGASGSGGAVPTFGRRNSVVGVGGMDARQMRRPSVADRGRRPSNAQLTASQMQSMPVLQPQSNQLGAGWANANSRGQVSRDLRGGGGAGGDGAESGGGYSMGPDPSSSPYDSLAGLSGSLPAGLRPPQVERRGSFPSQEAGAGGAAGNYRTPPAAGSPGGGMGLSGSPLAPSHGSPYSQGGYGPPGGQQSQGGYGSPGGGQPSPGGYGSPGQGGYGSPGQGGYGSPGQGGYGSPGGYPTQYGAGALSGAAHPALSGFTAGGGPVSYERQQQGGGSGYGPGSGYGGHYGGRQAPPGAQQGGGADQSGSMGQPAMGSAWGTALPSVQPWGGVRQGQQPAGAAPGGGAPGGAPGMHSGLMSPVAGSGALAPPTFSMWGADSDPRGPGVFGTAPAGGMAGRGSSDDGYGDGSVGDGSGPAEPPTNPPWWTNGTQTGAWGQPQTGFSVAALGSSLGVPPDASQRRASITGRDVLYRELPQDRNVMVRESNTQGFAYREAPSANELNRRDVIVRPTATSALPGSSAPAPQPTTTPANQAQILSALLHGSKLVFPQMDPSILGVQLTGKKLSGPAPGQQQQQQEQRGPQAPRK